MWIKLLMFIIGLKAALTRARAPFIAREFICRGETCQVLKT